MIYNDHNIFRNIINKVIDADIVYEDDAVIAFKDVHPVAPVHVLVIPKKQYISFHDFAAADLAEIGSFFQKVKEIAALLSLDEAGYRIITNHGDNAMQTIFHFHVHIIGGMQLGPLVAWDTQHSSL